MANSPHEALHRIFQEDTSLFARAFNRLLGVALPTPRAVSVLNTDATEIRPLERRIDTVLLAEVETGDQVVIVESQTERDDDKLISWPYYIAYLHAKYECPVTLLVISPKQTTAKWARQPIEIGPATLPCMVVRPFVLSPDNVPAVTDLAQACEDVLFTVFSALTHSRSEQAAAILKVLATALDTIDTDTAGYFAEFTEVGLGDTTARKAWRTLMSTQNYRYVSQLRAEGRAEGKAMAMLNVLDQRGIHVPQTVRDQILSCTDTTVLDGWLNRALTITSIEDLFA